MLNIRPGRPAPPWQQPGRASPRWDEKLRRFIEAPGGPHAERERSAFLAAAEPILQDTLRKKVGHSSDPRDRQAVEDLLQTARTRLCEWLHKLRSTAPAEPIEDHRRYVRGIVGNVWRDHLRQKYPVRDSLRLTLTYLCRKDPDRRGFAMWSGSSQQTLAGFAAWRDRGKENEPARREYRQLLEDPPRFAREALHGHEVGDLNSGLLAALFKGVGSPIPLNDLVAVVAKLLDIHEDVRSLDELAGEEDGSANEPVAPGSLEEEFIDRETQREFLARLWAEILQLSPLQRAALLLHPPDTGTYGLIELLELRGVATFREIAAALAVPAEHLAALAKRIPLPHAEIAGLRNSTPNAVAVARAKALDRLTKIGAER